MSWLPSIARADSKESRKQISVHSINFINIISGAKAPQQTSATAGQLKPRERWRLATALVLAQGLSEPATGHRSGRSSGDSIRIESTERIAKRGSNSKSQRRRTYIASALAGASGDEELSFAFHERLEWQRSDLRSELDRISRASHRYRLAYSGGLVGLGALLLAAVQACALAQSLVADWDFATPSPFVWQLSSFVAPAIMLLALRPCDRLAIRIAAGLLTALCFYYYMFLIVRTHAASLPHAHAHLFTDCAHTLSHPSLPCTHPCHYIPSNYPWPPMHPTPPATIP